jgi:hypothetical protein
VPVTCRIIVTSGIAIAVTVPITRGVIAVRRGVKPEVTTAAIIAAAKIAITVIIPVVTSTVAAFATIRAAASVGVRGG